VTVLHHHVGGDFGGHFEGEVGVGKTARAVFGVDFESDEAAVTDVGPEDQTRAGLEKLDGLNGGAFGDGAGEVSVFAADDDFALVFVEGEHFRVGQDDGVGDAFQGVEEDGNVVLDDADAKSSVGDVSGESGADGGVPPP
jgi:hypothetical protein